MSNLQNANHLVESIRDGITRLGLQPDKIPVASYLSYIELLKKWNRAYNLTAINDPERMVSHHILDSLSVLPYLKGDYCIDVGTGAGLPGLILALAMPEKEWILLDSNQKKIRFLNQAIIDLEIKNVTAIRCRAEEFKPERLFTTVITRAYGSLALIHDQTRHLLSPDGVILAMKGNITKKELDVIDESAQKVQIHILHVPSVREHRSLVEITPLPSAN